MCKAKTRSASEEKWVVGFPFMMNCEGYDSICIGTSPLFSKDYDDVVGGDWYFIQEDTICKYIGKRDSNGECIFEKDVVEYQEFSKDTPASTALVVYDFVNCSYRLYDLSTKKLAKKPLGKYRLTVQKSSFDDMFTHSVTRFKGTYEYLSNFYPAPVMYKGIMYMSNEVAFQAQKCPERAEEFSQISNPIKAKRLGRSVCLREDWEDVKDYIMYQIVKAKFIQNRELRENLLDTGYCHLEEGNNWQDRYWGTCNGLGENKLGKILMRVRDEIRYSE